MKAFARLVYQAWEVDRSEVAQLDATRIVFEPENNTQVLSGILGLCF
jgi:hypothetical protein